jgi:uncharacterized protein
MTCWVKFSPASASENRPHVPRETVKATSVLMDLAVLCAGAFFAGLVDAMVGGGGLVQIPLLFNVYPNVPPATLFGTNKAVSVVGTTFAARRYLRGVDMDWQVLWRAALAAFVASFAGAATVGLFPPDMLRPLIIVLLLAVLGYTLKKKDFGVLRKGAANTPRPLLALVLGATIGFYDGFFGPGTGSFLIFLFVRCYAWDFLRASAAAKVVNVSTNLAALAWFVPAGAIMGKVALMMAAANLAGAWIGAHLAIKNGAAFVRRVFIVVVGLLIARLLWDSFAG